MLRKADAATAPRATLYCYHDEVGVDSEAGVDSPGTRYVQLRLCEDVENAVRSRGVDA
jgi:hypothetical protein